jgi:serpin B
MKRFFLLILLASALPAADSRIMPAMNAFTTASYKQLAPGDANLILSPFNISTALSMVLAGARGQTAHQIASVLHVRYDPTYDAALGALLVDLAKAGSTGGSELHTANALWVQQGFPIVPAFETSLASNYHAPPTPLDFIANPEAARSRINAWTEEQTKEKIKNLLPAGSLNAATRLVLTSALYFYGKWQSPFVSSRTQPAPFTLPTGAAAQADFMNQTAHFLYADTPAAQVLEMPYAETGIAFDVVLPKTSTGLPALEASLTPETLAGWIGKLETANVQLSLPKFRVESQFSLRDTLSAMGMPLAFTHQADFSGIDPKGELAISAVLHKAFVEVAEQGTEAAAATAVTMRATAMRMTQPPVVFRADHPFLFLIRDTRTGVVLFIGRLTTPG